MAGPEDMPSPVMPMILLGILMMMLMFSSMFAYDPTYWTDTIEQVQTHFVAGAFLIPICLLLAVQAFGIPQVNATEARGPPSPLMEAATQSLTTSVLLVFVIFVLLMLLPLRGAIQGPAASRW